MERITSAGSLGRILDWCMEQSATDLHAQADRRYAYRVDRLLLRIPPEVFPTPTNDDVVTMLGEAFSSSTCDRIEMEMHGLVSSLPGILKPDPER